MQEHDPNDDTLTDIDPRQVALAAMSPYENEIFRMLETSDDCGCYGDDEGREACLYEAWRAMRLLGATTPASTEVIATVVAYCWRFTHPEANA